MEFHRARQLNRELLDSASAIELLEHVEKNVTKFNVVNVSSALHRLARFLQNHVVKTNAKSRHKLYQKAAGEFRCASERHLSSKSLTSSSWALATLCSVLPDDRNLIKPVVAALGAAARRSITLLDARAISNVVWMFGKIGFSDKELLHCFCKASTPLFTADKFSPMENSTLVWSLATLGISGPMPMMRAASASARRSISAFSAQGLGNIIWAFTKLGFIDRALMSAASLESISRAEKGSLDAESISKLVWAFGKISDDGVDRSECVRVATALAAAAELKAASFSSRSLACALTGFGSLGIDSSTLALKMLPLVSGMSAEQSVYTLSSIDRLPMDQARKLLPAVLEQTLSCLHDIAGEQLGVLASTMASLYIKFGRGDNALTSFRWRKALRALLRCALRFGLFSWRDAGNLESCARLILGNKKIDKFLETVEDDSSALSLGSQLNQRTMQCLAEANRHCERERTSPTLYFCRHIISHKASLRHMKSAFVIDDEDDQFLVSKTLEDAGLIVDRWCRWSHGKHRGQAHFDESGFNDVGIVRLPGSAAALSVALAAVASHLRRGASLFVYGLVAEGIQSCSLEPLFGESKLISSSSSLAIVQATRLHTSAPSLPSFLQQHSLVVAGNMKQDWFTYPGFFAQGLLDQMTAVLIEELPLTLEPGLCALDFACGSGMIGAVLMHRSPHLKLDMLDADALAIESARLNVKGARRFYVSDCWPRKRRHYDLIVSNPPYHRGAPDCFSVVQDLVEGAADRLTPSGQLWIVAQEQVPVGRMMNASMKYRSIRARLVGNSRFVVWSAMPSLRTVESDIKLKAPLSKRLRTSK